jgi:hypothetical protein
MDDILNVRIEPAAKRALEIMVATEGNINKKAFISEAILNAVPERYIRAAREAIKKDKKIDGK